MKLLILISIFLFPTFLIGQLNSYEDSYETVKITFDMAFSTDENTKFIIRAKEDYELQITTVSDEKEFSKQKKLSFQLAKCEPCKLNESMEPKNPIGVILKEIKLKDVFIIEKNKRLML
jgi:hypothetical protein